MCYKGYEHEYLERILAKPAMGLKELLKIHLVSQILCCQLAEVNVRPYAGYGLSHVVVIRNLI